jgi:hypothetical protein
MTRIITPKTHDFTKTGDTFTLIPPVDKTWEVQAVTMTFDGNIQYDDTTSGIIVEMYSPLQADPVKQYVYRDMVDWIENATTYKCVSGLLESADIHQIYINFSTKFELGKQSQLSHITIRTENGQPLKAKDHGKAIRARGEYIIEESDI